MFAKIIALSSVLYLLAGVNVLSVQSSVQPAAQPHNHQQEAHQKEEHSHHAGFVKPGAGVALEHDYNGVTGVGHIETLTLKLSHLYDDGYISTALLSPPQLHIYSQLSALPERVSRGSVISLPLQFSGMQEGSYTIGVEVVFKTLDGHQSRRVLSVPVVIGSQTAAKFQTRPKPREAKRAGPQGIIALPAQEVIR